MKLRIPNLVRFRGVNAAQGTLKPTSKPLLIGEEPRFQVPLRGGEFKRRAEVLQPGHDGGAERLQDTVRVSSIGIDNDDDLVGLVWSSAELIPRGLGEFLHHFGLESPASRWYAHTDQPATFFEKPCEETGEGEPFGFARGDDDNPPGHDDYAPKPLVSWNSPSLKPLSSSACRTASERSSRVISVPSSGSRLTTHTAPGSSR